MYDLFKAEVLRFRTWSIAAALVHLLVLAFLARVVDLAQQPLLVYRVFGGVYVVSGLLFGLYQMGSYRRPSVWLNLLHRPVPAWRIALALSGAAVCWLAVVVALPVLLVAVAQHGMTARVVDLRHWLLPAASLLIATCGYLAGAHAMLANRRWSACGLVFLAWLVVAHASGFAALALQLLALAWLGTLLAIAVKPDLSAPPRKAWGVVVAALPVQAGVYLLVLLLGFGIEMLWIMQGTHPNNMATPPPGGYNEAERMQPRARMLAGLLSSRDARAPLWREQVALSEVHEIGVQLPWRLQRNSLTNHAPMEFEDSVRRIDWVFSHDRMRFEGRQIVDGRTAGELGAGGADAVFPAPAMGTGPWPGMLDGDAVIIAGNALYHYDSEARQALPRIQLPHGELLLGAVPVGESWVVSSDRALYFFDGRDASESETLMHARQRLQVPGEQGDLRTVDMIELVDGYLVSFLFSNQPQGPTGAPPYQATVWLRDDGRSMLVSRRGLHHDYPAWYRYKAWWPSPFLYAVRMHAIGLFAVPDPLERTAPPPVPRAIVILAGLLMLVSLMAGAWLARRRTLSRRARVGWSLACGIVGLPGLASLWLMVPERA